MLHWILAPRIARIAQIAQIAQIAVEQQKTELPQAEPRHMRRRTQTTREMAGWMAGWRTYDQGTCHALGWLAGWGASWLAG